MAFKGTGRALAAISILALGAGGVLAKGGTAKPPPTTGASAVLPAPDPRTRSFPSIPAAPSVTADNMLHQFDITGFIQSFDNVLTDAGVTCPAPPASGGGGHVTVNGIKIIIPCNTIVQMPANTLKWDEFTAVTATQPAIDLATISNTVTKTNTVTGGVTTSTTSAPAQYPSVEIRVVGNWIDTGGTRKYIAALVYASQQSTNTGSGVITSIDYATGHILATTTGGVQVRLEINDPNGRFGRATHRDDRLKVDDENPTITAATGYPMCVPRVLTEPDGVATDDPRCPVKNRPLKASTCRTYASMGITTPTAGATTFFQDPNNTYCTAFVMRAHPGTTAGSISGSYPPASEIAKGSEPDAREQAPFRKGDMLTWSGSVMLGVNTAAGAASPLAEPIISVHTITANVGIYTQPGTLPVYVRIGEFGLAGDLAPAGGATTLGDGNGNLTLPMEVQNRMFVESDVTDITAIVDVYLVDTDPKGLVDRNGLNPLGDVSRWVTPLSMTSRDASGQDTSRNNALIGYQGNITFGPVTYPKPEGFDVEGGIVTQWEGAQIGRARMRATKAAVGLLASPSRNIRAVVRTLCKPDNINTNVNARLSFSGGKTLDGAVSATGVGGGLGWKPQLTAQTYATSGLSVGPGISGQPSGAPINCVGRIVAANGLKTGQYSAPVSEYIFPEGTSKGAPIVPNNFWDYSFLWIGDDSAPGPLNPKPWCVGATCP